MNFFSGNRIENKNSVKKQGNYALLVRLILNIQTLIKMSTIGHWAMPLSSLQFLQSQAKNTK